MVGEMRGLLLIISGPSGVGKTTVCRRLADELDAHLSVSSTTRRPRDNEVDGQDYFFISIEEFERDIGEDKWLEYARVYGGHYYGTPSEPVLRALQAGRVVILEIEIEGTIQVKRKLPEAVAIYVLAPTPSDQQRRIVGRNMDRPEAIRERLSKADGEIRYAQESGVYDHYVINDDVRETVDEIKRIVQEKQRA